MRISHGCVISALTLGCLLTAFVRPASAADWIRFFPGSTKELGLEFYNPGDDGTIRLAKYKVILAPDTPGKDSRLQIRQASFRMVVRVLDKNVKGGSRKQEYEISLKKYKGKYPDIYLSDSLLVAIRTRVTNKTNLTLTVKDLPRDGAHISTPPQDRTIGPGKTVTLFTLLSTAPDSNSSVFSVRTITLVEPGKPDLRAQIYLGNHLSIETENGGLKIQQERM